MSPPKVDVPTLHLKYLLLHCGLCRDMLHILGNATHECLNPLLLDFSIRSNGKFDCLQSIY